MERDFVEIGIGKMGDELRRRWKMGFAGDGRWEMGDGEVEAKDYGLQAVGRALRRSEPRRLGRSFLLRQGFGERVGGFKD
jgi:hypothetical protein